MPYKKLTLLFVLLFACQTAVASENPDAPQASEINSPAEITHRVPPVMPARAETSGYCCLMFDVNKRGQTRNVSTTYCTDPIFSKSSKTAAKQFQYRPAHKAGKPVRSYNETAIITYFLTMGFGPNKGQLIPSATGFPSKINGVLNKDTPCNLPIS